MESSKEIFGKVAVKTSVFDTAVGRLLIRGDTAAVTYLGWTDKEICYDPDHDVLRGLIEAAVQTGDYSQVPIRLEGTEFQLNVWRAIRTVQPGETISYKELATRAGNSSAVRAAASACGKNKVCLLVPCHRIVKQTGAIGKYRWGVDLKKFLLDREVA